MVISCYDFLYIMFTKHRTKKRLMHAARDLEVVSTV